MFVYTIDDIIGWILIGIFVLLLVLYIGSAFVAYLIDAFSRWRSYKGERTERKK